MSPLWRGFAGLVVVFSLAYYVTHMEAESDREFAMIMEHDPVLEAQQAFDDAQYFFYQRYFRRLDPDTGADIGYWILQGESEIDPRILQKYKNRVSIKSSLNYGLTPEHQSLNKRLPRWISQFNLKMAELLSE